MCGVPENDPRSEIRSLVSALFQTNRAQLTEALQPAERLHRLVLNRAEAAFAEQLLHCATPISHAMLLIVTTEFAIKILEEYLRNDISTMEEILVAHDRFACHLAHLGSLLREMPYLLAQIGHDHLEMLIEDLEQEGQQHQQEERVIRNTLLATMREETEDRLLKLRSDLTRVQDELVILQLTKAAQDRDCASDLQLYLEIAQMDR